MGDLTIKTAQNGEGLRVKMNQNLQYIDEMKS